jgi:ornithine cyclodeaminase/alanine dehydrogenase-like protein (mu-crystallin family)
MRVIDAKTIGRLMPMGRCIDVVEDAMRALSRGTLSAPLRTMLPLPGGEGAFGVMPAAAVSGGAFGAKLISVMPQNPKRGHPSVQGVVVIFDPSTGAPAAVIAGGPLTELRTAAASGLAARLLSRTECRTHLIIGAGALALPHAMAIKAARESIDNTLIWSRRIEDAQKAARAIERECGLSAAAVPDRQEAASLADIISTVTSASEPVLFGEWVKPGTHVNLVGPHSPQEREADTALITRAEVYIDSRHSAEREAGDLLLPIAEGAFSFDRVVGEIGALADGDIPGRSGAEAITIYKSVGHAAQDLFVASALAALAEEHDLGASVDLDG